MFLRVFLVLVLLFSSSLKAQEEAERILTQFERDYILLKKGKFEFEESFSYIYYTSNQVFLESFAILDPIFLTLGRFGIERIRRHILVNMFTLRYGLTDNLQVDLAIPIVYRYEEGAVAETGDERSAERFGLGDIAIGFSFQPIRESHRRPAVVLSLVFKTRTGKGPFDVDPENDVPTGSGYYAIKGGINLLKSIDPVVIFGGLAYSYNMERTVNKLIVPNLAGGSPTFIEKVDPGDTITLNFGFAYALSYRFSFSMQYVQNFFLYTYIWERGKGKRRVPNSQFNNTLLKVGTSWILSPRTSLNVALSIGLTADSPDYVLEFRIPYRF